MSDTPDHFALYLDASAAASNFHAAHICEAYDKVNVQVRRDAAIAAIEKIAAALGRELVPRTDVVMR